MLLEHRNKRARLAGTLLLFGALTYTFFPLRQQFEFDFVDHDVSEEMQVSEFLNNNVPASSVLYSNFNYPLFGYYTNLPVKRLPDSSAELYDALNRLPQDGILIAYKENDTNGDPRIEWLDSNPHFRRFKEFPPMVLYEYRVRAERGN
jgi:hypothetical protein